MRKHLKILLIFYFCLFASCSKDGGSDIEQSDFAVPETLTRCTHTSLEHHSALAPTHYDFGNVEYWECPNCRNIFSDPEAKLSFTGYRYLLPTRFADWRINNPFSYNRNATKRISGTTVAAIASASVDLVATSLTIASLCDDNAENIAKINEIEEKVDKTNNDLAELSTLYESVNVQMTEVNNSLIGLNACLSGLIDDMKTTQALIDDTQNKLNQSLSIISEVEKEISAKELLYSRSNKLKELRLSSLHILSAMLTHYTEYSSAIMMAGNDIEKVELQILFSAQIKQLISSWAAEGSDFPSATIEILESSSRLDYGGLSSYTDLLDAFSTDHYVWFQQGLSFKEIMLDFDCISLSVAYSLAYMYYTLRPDMDQKYKQRRLDRINTEYTGYKTDIEMFFDKLDSLYCGDKICNATKKVFNPDPMVFAIDDLMSQCNAIIDNNPQNISNDVDNILQSHIDYLQSVSSMDTKDWELMQRACYAEEKNNWNILFSNDNGGLAFNSLSLTDDSLLIIPSEMNLRREDSSAPFNVVVDAYNGAEKQSYILFCYQYDGTCVTTYNKTDKKFFILTTKQNEQ